MWTLLARGRTSTTRLLHRALRPPRTVAEHTRRIIWLAVVGVVATTVSAFGTLALTADPDGGPTRGVTGISDERTVRDLQLPTL